MTQGLIDVEQLEEMANAGEIDTVLCMFTDLQGRFMGKRVLPHFFLEEVLGDEGLHACLYLLAVDMEMEPLPGYEYASWETGYGDFMMVPDLTTLRLCPWLEKTAMVLCDIADEETNEPVEVAPRQILKRPDRAGGGDGLHGQDRLGAGVLPVPGLVRRGGGARLPGHATRRRSYIMDYHMLQTTKDEWIIRKIRNDMRARASRSSSPRESSARVSTRSTSRTATCCRDGRQPRRCTSTASKEIAALNGGGRDVHGEVDDGRGRLVVPHALQHVERRRHRVAHVGRRRPHHMSATFRSTSAA